MRRRWWPGGSDALPREMAIEEIWRRHFERRAEWAISDAQRSAWSADGLAARLAAFENLLPELASNSDAVVLDLGCGAATYTTLLAKKGHAVTAVDYSFPMVHRARASHARARFAVADGHHAPFKTASFDLVLCIGILQYSAKPAVLIGEAARLVRPGGALLVETLNPVHFVVPAIKLLELSGWRSRSPLLLRHSVSEVEKCLDTAGIARSGRVAIYVLPTSDGYAASAVRVVTRSLRRVPPLRRFAVSAIWWSGRRR